MAYRMQGFGTYEHTGNWGWEFFPPPYDFLAPRNSAPMPAPFLPGGLGCAGCGGTCGGGCARPGVGMGLFDSGLDLAGWGVGEWLTVAAGVFVVRAVFGQAGRDVKAVRRVAGRKSRVRRISQRIS